MINRSLKAGALITNSTSIDIFNFNDYSVVIKVLNDKVIFYLRIHLVLSLSSYLLRSLIVSKSYLTSGETPFLSHSCQ
jgi:N-acetylglutamate synthase-like GNAT family acetyltransferase